MEMSEILVSVYLIDFGCYRMEYANKLSENQISTSFSLSMSHLPRKANFCLENNE